MANADICRAEPHPTGFLPGIALAVRSAIPAQVERWHRQRSTWRGLRSRDDYTLRIGLQSRLEIMAYRRLDRPTRCDL